MTRRALIWFKRDLRVADHAPLAQAAEFDEVVALFVVEPEWTASPECDPQHLAFAAASVAALRRELQVLGLALLVRHGAMPQVLADLRREFAFSHLLSHEETGPLWSWHRDQRVARWCRAEGVSWHEHPQTGVVRRLRDRRGWAARWQQRMDAPLVVPPGRLRAAPALVPGEFPPLASLGATAHRSIPPAGPDAARATLDSFLEHRGRQYRVDLSSPTRGERGCSRLSAHLAFGAISMRQVHQATEARIAALRAEGSSQALAFAHQLRGFAGRLRWHCHFMQKLEDEPEIEQRNFARSADALREAEFNDAHFRAWCEGRTGFPMVDACMRSLLSTGWLNFRMRAMLVSFAAYHLWLHWREPGLFLARQFLDFEPGIHWSQMQMQSGTTGINTLRIYSPSKQAADHDPRGEFIQRWIPEHGTDAYARPIVDERSALARARARLYAWRATPQARAEADAIQARHGSRRSGLPPSGRAAKPSRSGRPAPASAGSTRSGARSDQAELFE